MLSSTSAAQKHLSEEDSSGSDAGSEVGQEPETDRFGFILTNGSTAGSLGPPPELVRQRETKWIHIMSQWDRILLKKTSKVKVQCQKGIPASLRAKCWPLLCGGTDKMKQNETLYQSLDSQPALQSWVDVIERDLDRQFPFHEMFLSKDGHGQQGLFRVLKAFTQYQPEEGYCQAQGPVAAVLLMNMPAEEAFWCLVQISEQYLPGYYSPLLEGVLFDAAMLNWVLKRTCPAAHKHLQRHGVEPLMFATDWLMCLFTRHLPFNTLLRVWDLFFCYGVRVLLQVASVLVRRVLGRAEQRKQCQGQMETLERLRAVMEQVQEEDDTFIAEVCSVQLSARDLEKQTEKELEKWRKDRPSSTFDPRGRCHGYRMAWARARQNEEVRDRKEREKGNLSVPLARSASTLSLSPSLLHKKWKKGGKANSREWEGGGGKVVRHLSMGAKEDSRGWTEFHFKKVQRVQEEEDVVFEDHQKESELKLTQEIEQKKLLEEPKMMEIPNMPTEHVEETVIVEEQVEQVETRITEKEESQINNAEESRVPSDQKEETNEETQQTKDRNVELKQGDELDSNSQTQVQQSDKIKHLEIQGKDSNKETENQVAESENTNAVVENLTEIKEDADADKNTKVETQECVHLSEEQMIQADMKSEESTETENVQQTQVDAVTTETRTGSETDSKVKAPTIKDPTMETETQQQEVITETDRRSQGDAFEETYHSSESLAETETKKESHTPTATETNQLAQTQEKLEENAVTQESESEIVQMDSEQHIDSKTEAETFILCSPQYIQPEGADLEADTETEAEILVANDIVTESSAAFGKECDAAASEPPQEEEERCLDEHSEAKVDQTQAEETPTETETNTLIAPPHEEEKERCLDEHSEAKVDQTQAEETPTETETNTLIAPPQEKERCLEEHSEAKVDQTQAEETPTETETNTLIAPPQEEEERCLEEHSEAKVDQTQAEETPTETETNTLIAPPQEEEDVTQAEVRTQAGADGKTSSVETEEPAPEQPPSLVTISAVVEEESTETVQENTVGEDDVFISTEPTDSPNTDRIPEVQDKDSRLVTDQDQAVNSGLTQAPGQRSSRSSGDFCVRKSSNSRGSRLARRLSEDLFIMSEKTSQSQSAPNHPEVKPSQLQSNPGAVNPTQSPSDVTSEVSSSPSAEVTPAVQPKRFGLFRRLRGEQVKKAPKMQIPKILIQDYSDGTGTGKPVEEEGEDKLSSRERRKRRRDRERKEKEEERLKKKREKELGKEKERERRKPQTRGQSFQVQREKRSSDVTQPAKTGSQTLRYNASYAESYF